MSLDIDWSLLSSSSSSLSETLITSLNTHLSSTNRPSFIGPITVQSFDFGTNGPEIEIKDVRDVWRAFDEGDIDDDEDEDENELDFEGMGEEDGTEYLDNSLEYGGRGYDSFLDGSGHLHDARDLLINGRHGSKARNGLDDDTYEVLLSPGRSNMPGGEEEEEDGDDDNVSLFSGVSYKPSRVASSVGMGFGLQSNNIRGLGTMNGAIGGPSKRHSAGYVPRSRISSEHEKYFPGSTTENTKNGLNNGLSGMGREGRISRSNTLPSYQQYIDSSNRTSPLSNQMKLSASVHPSQLNNPRSNYHSHHHYNSSYSHEMALQHKREIRTRLKEKREKERKMNNSEKGIPSIQLHLNIKHSSNIQITLLTCLNVNYPSLAFMSLPLKISITGIDINADLVLAYSSNKHRVHLSLVDTSSEEDEDDSFDSFRSEGDGYSGSFGFNGKVGNKFREKEDIGSRILKNIQIESEIGHTDAHVLRNVGKVERFIVDAVRKTMVEEVVFPNFQTVAL